MKKNSPSILVVDDSETNLVLLTAVLGDAGWEVMTANSAAAAMEMIQESVPRLILLDLLMPEIDGFKMLDTLKSDKRYQDIPVIVISAVNDPDSRELCLQKGAIDYMPKPVNIKELEARVKSILG